MNEYTASNGVTITRYAESLEALDHDLESSAWMTPRLVDALREFFRAEEDERLGRWRWPDNPEYVVYARDSVEGSRGRGFRVMDEASGDTWSYDETGLRDCRGEAWEAARAYFDAHPEPKPWHDAEEGDIWVLDLAASGESPWHVVGQRFENVQNGAARPLNDKSFRAGYRIYPEAS